jgi:drug/metabolite transporter (DMT)-like permease
MELWFMASVVGAVLGGISNFTFKQAAVGGYSSELFSLYGGATSVITVGAFLLVFPQSLLETPVWAVAVFTTGMLAAVSGVLKVYALRYIDSTIYFPLFKLLAPLLAIIAGVVLIGERFSLWEWFGIIVGLLVPLMLITKAEDARQNNLVMGLLLVVITGALSALAATTAKLAIDVSMSASVALWYTVLGILVGSVLSVIYKVGTSKVVILIQEESSWKLLRLAVTRSIFIASSVGLMFFAFANGGTLAVVQTIHSMYILIPIVLAIIFYNEHWNLQKALAIVLSVVSLAFLG